MAPGAIHFAYFISCMSVYVRITCYVFSGKILLFVVNHAPGIDKIEKFEYIEKDQMLKHLQSYTDDAIRV